MEKRSLLLNNYYWGVVVPHSSEALIYAGWERERFTHAELVHKFWKTLLGIPSTADLNNKKFLDFVEDIKRIASCYLMHYIPDPNEDLEEEIKGY
ncbi:hypothetical protein ACFSQ3_14665 [Sphingobacterium corticis]|uniref:Uncharacterized protein n=1 Tax=Sphingobacterium corticis TaxID=1812823 RepID=A0ABW5NNH5_9SPHI